MDSVASQPEENGGGSTPQGGNTAPRISLGKGRALVPVPVAPKAKRFEGIGRSHGLVAAGVAVVMGIGFVAGTAAFASKTQPAVLAQATPVDTTLEALSRLQGEVRALRAGLDGTRVGAEEGRDADTIRALKKSVDLLKGDLEGVRAASAGAVGQLGAKLDRLDRDPGPKLAEIVARLDRLDREPDARIAQATSQLAARIDRVERRFASGDTTGAIPAGAAAADPLKAPLPPPRAPQPSPTGPAAVPLPRPDATARAEPPRADPARMEPTRPEAAPPRSDAPRQEAANRPATLDGWLLRDVYGGVALVEGRAGGLREVAPGEFVPGVGEIRSIERRGRGWVVVTSRGIIQADNRW